MNAVGFMWFLYNMCIYAARINEKKNTQAAIWPFYLLFFIFLPVQIIPQSDTTSLGCKIN